MRAALIWRPRDAAPPEAFPILLGALGQWVERYTSRFATFEFFVVGGGLAIADLDDSAELLRIVAENPFTPYMDVDIMPVVDPATGMQAYGEVASAFSAATQPSG
jgi:Domain of unknown function (DUF3303)